MKKPDHAVFTREMRKAGYLILIPNMLDFHFSLLEQVFQLNGYNLEVLTNDGPNVVAEGLKYVHNDTCVPALLVIGQFMDALHSGKYDLHRVALMISQTGGGCRASNYIFLLRKALKKAGLEYIPVISINLSGMEKGGGFRLTLRMIRHIFAGAIYGDCIMHLSNQTRPYEDRKGDTDALILAWRKRLIELFSRDRGLSKKELRANLEKIAADFDAIPRTKKDLTRVGIVGEIYVKYCPLGNNHLEDFLRRQDCEYMVPGVTHFLQFKIDNRIEDIGLYGGNPLKLALCRAFLRFVNRYEDIMLEAIKAHPSFTAPASYAHTKSLVKDVIGYGSKMGEGWLLTAEMLELKELGYGNIICTQPFGCLPNHINGKGMIRRLSEVCPGINIVPIDYDPSATKVNQENRIRLMLSVAADA